MFDNRAKLEKGKRGFDIVMIEHEMRYLSTASMYQPIDEARGLVSSIGKKELFIFIGFGSGYVFNEIKIKYPLSKIIVFEPIHEVIHIMSQDPSMTAIANSLVLIPTIDEGAIRSAIRSHFLPHTDFTLHIGISANYEKIIGGQVTRVKKAIEESIYDLIGDYQTQAAFAKVWLRNMAKNALFIRNSDSPFAKIKKNKKALVLGAGPKAFELLKQNRDLSAFDVYCTDTAYHASLAFGLKSAAVGVIDPQMQSRWHLPPWLAKPSLVVAPLTAFVHGSRLPQTHFLGSRHPLLQLILGRLGQNNLVDTNAGNIGAYLVRLAIELGYEIIETLGLDFSYSRKRPYLIPSYFDTQFLEMTDRTLPLTQLFSELYLSVGIFDDELIKTPRLESYRSSFIEELQSLELDFVEKSRGNFEIRNHHRPREIVPITRGSFELGVKDLYETLNSDPELKYRETLELCLPNLAQKQRERLQKNEKTVDTFESDVKSAYAEVCLFSQKLYEGLSYGR